MSQIICVVAGVKESYHNTRTIYTLLNLDQHPHMKFVCDLKAMMFFVGTMKARSK